MRRNPAVDTSADVPRVAVFSPGRISDPVAARRMPSSPLAVPSDCQHCGVCCFSESAEYVWVTGYDWTRLATDAGQLAHFIGNRAFMKMENGHCAALKVLN